MYSRAVHGDLYTEVRELVCNVLCCKKVRVRERELYYAEICPVSESAA